MQVNVAYESGWLGEIAAGSVARFIFALLIAVAAMIAHSPIFLCFLVIFTIMAFFSWGGGFSRSLKLARYLIFLLGFVFLLHLSLHPGKAIFSIWFLHATIEGAREGILYGLKLIVLAFTAYIIFLTTDPFELISPLERLAKLLGSRGRLISSLALAFFLAMRFLPELSEQARLTMLAFRSKGLDLKGGLSRKATVISLMIPPLFVIAMKRSEITAAALNAKGYATRYSRAVIPPWRITFGDLVTILAALTILITGWRAG